jgi:polyhydroxybutyrate depolymerase
MRSFLFNTMLVILSSSPIISFSQVQTGGFEFEGRMRNYLVFLPQNYDGVTKMPLVLNLHGYTLYAQQQLDYSQMNLVADTAGFVVVYPNSVTPETTWNSGIYDSPIAPANPNINDVGFLSALIDTLAEHSAIDAKRIYCCGFSNGGFMSFKLACQLSNKIAAIASVAGVISYTTASGCNCDSMPVLIINGTADGIVPYAGTTGWHSVEQTVNFWTTHNLCSESDTTSLPDTDALDGCTVERIRFTDLSGNHRVIFHKVMNGGHTWPSGDKRYLFLSWGDIGKTNGDINASAEIWNFLRAYRLSGPTTVATHSQSPREFLLFQNYPNPFNPSTTIKFELPRASQVGLTVCDILGREVSVLLNERKNAGSYEVKFDGQNLSSGVYFYRLRAGDVTQTKRLLLLK